MMARAWVSGDGSGVGARPATLREVLVPSVTGLRAWAAGVGGRRAVGVVLTGMGDDGTRGLAAVRGAGGLTLAESERTAVVFGMPRHALAAQVVDRVLPLEGIGPALVDLVLEGEMQDGLLPGGQEHGSDATHNERRSGP
jgi:chemotaxis response regulator CheB